MLGSKSSLAKPLLSAFMCAGLLSTALAGTALAEEAATAPMSGDESVTDGARAGEFSPGGCNGKANWPHDSHHVAGKVNSEARTYCNNFPPSWLWAEAHLQRLEWWGWDFKGEPTAASKNNAWAISAFDNTACVRDDWRTKGKHRTYEFGRYYSGSTTSASSFVPCNF